MRGSVTLPGYCNVRNAEVLYVRTRDDKHLFRVSWRSDGGGEHVTRTRPEEELVRAIMALSEVLHQITGTPPPW